MSTPINNGGPAFPMVKKIGEIYHTGMSLRDWFAGQALVGLASNQTFLIHLLDKHAHEDVVEALASAACKVADAMIEARNQKGTKA